MKSGSLVARAKLILSQPVVRWTRRRITLHRWAVMTLALSGASYFSDICPEEIERAVSVLGEGQ